MPPLREGGADSTPLSLFLSKKTHAIELLNSNLTAAFSLMKQTLKTFLNLKMVLLSYFCLRSKKAEVRKQKEDGTVGEYFTRKRRDSNPWHTCVCTNFRNWHLKPLGHSSFLITFCFPDYVIYKV